MDIVADGPTLVLSGDFDVRSTTAAREAIYDHLAGHDDVVLDLSAVDAVDLTALRLVAVASLVATREGHHLLLRGCGPAVRRMLHLSRLRGVVEIEDAEATA